MGIREWGTAVNWAAVLPCKGGFWMILLPWCWETRGLSMQLRSGELSSKPPPQLPGWDRDTQSQRDREYKLDSQRAVRDSILKHQSQGRR